MYGPAIPANAAEYKPASASMYGGADVGAYSLRQLAAHVRIGGKGAAHVTVWDAERAKRHAVLGVKVFRSRPMAGRHALRAMGRVRRSERPPMQFRFGVMRGTASSCGPPDNRGWPHAESWSHAMAPAKRCCAMPDGFCCRMGRLGICHLGQPGMRPCVPFNRCILSGLFAGTLREWMSVGWRLLRKRI